MDSIPGSGGSSGVGNGNPLQYSCLENPMDRGAWWATIHGVAKSWTRLNKLTQRLNLAQLLLDVTQAPGSLHTEQRPALSRLCALGGKRATEELGKIATPSCMSLRNAQGSRGQPS